MSVQQTRLVMYVIYDHPKDCPDKFVLRRWSEDRGDPVPCDVVASGDTIEQVRAALPGDLVCIPRHPSDDPVIVETWMG